jgi:hypothetical protein
MEYKRRILQPTYTRKLIINPFNQYYMTLLIWLKELSHEKVNRLFPDVINSTSWGLFQRELYLYGLSAFTTLDDDLQNNLIKIYSSIID